MQRKMQARLASLPTTETSFIEPMECLSVSKLPEGATWICEALHAAIHSGHPLAAGYGRMFLFALIPRKLKRVIFFAKTFGEMR